MKTPFGEIKTAGRARSDALADYEHTQTHRLGETLTEIGRDLRRARTVGDVLDIEEKIGGLSDDLDRPRVAAANDEPEYDHREEAARVDLVPEVPSVGGDTTPPAIALYGFVAWLTSRDEVAGLFSSHHDAAPAVDLLERFADSQGYSLQLPEDWTERLRPYPVGSVRTASQTADDPTGLPGDPGSAPAVPTESVNATTDQAQAHPQPHDDTQVPGQGAL